LKEFKSKHNGLWERGQDATSLARDSRILWKERRKNNVKRVHSNDRSRAPLTLQSRVVQLIMAIPYMSHNYTTANSTTANKLNSGEIKELPITNICSACDLKMHGGWEIKKLNLKENFIYYISTKWAVVGQHNKMFDMNKITIT
jgi:hypothetical protein